MRGSGARVAWAALLLLCLVFVVGCFGRGPVGQTEADELRTWLDTQSYSEWSTWRQADREPHHPPSPDGLTLGSPNIFAAIGTDPDDLSVLDTLWCDSRTVRPLARPMTLAVRLEGKGISPSDSQSPVALAAFPDQTLRRISQTSIAISESARPDLKLTCVDFAPMERQDNFLCRWFLAENT
ncbi:MAG: hypothetical protein JXE06_10080, partial [Coriobacteriia bacterium]|nr:hypothetical protein [Coriobacteriia bacterium]